ncbi:hypothetical protein RNN53_25995, partial [Escherichia coli]|nr:hypothetical protein [Escherichia coli]MDT1599850.1 hypothetical protein [Escherichia coli]
TDGDGSHGSTSKTPSYTKSVSWHHYQSNEDKSPFCNVREMTDTVQNYYHEYGGNDTCPLCTKHIDD